MADLARDPDRRQAGGWHGEGAGEGEGLHVREVMLVDGVADPPLALVVRLYADFWITTVEDWEKED